MSLSWLACSKAGDVPSIPPWRVNIMLYVCYAFCQFWIWTIQTINWWKKITNYFNNKNNTCSSDPACIGWGIVLYSTLITGFVILLLSANPCKITSVRSRALMKFFLLPLDRKSNWSPVLQLFHAIALINQTIDSQDSVMITLEKLLSLK